TEAEARLQGVDARQRLVVEAQVMPLDIGKRSKWCQPVEQIVLAVQLKAGQGCFGGVDVLVADQARGGLVLRGQYLVGDVVMNPGIETVQAAAKALGIRAETEIHLM